MSRPLAKFKIGAEITVYRNSVPDIFGTIYDVLTFEDWVASQPTYEYAIQTDDGPITYARECDVELRVSDRFKHGIDGLLEI